MSSRQPFFLSCLIFHIVHFTDAEFFGFNSILELWMWNSACPRGTILAALALVLFKAFRVELSEKTFHPSGSLLLTCRSSCFWTSERNPYWTVLNSAPGPVELRLQFVVRPDSRAGKAPTLLVRDPACPPPCWHYSAVLALAAYLYCCLSIVLPPLNPAMPLSLSFPWVYLLTSQHSLSLSLSQSHSSHPLATQSSPLVEQRATFHSLTLSLSLCWYSLSPPFRLTTWRLLLLLVFRVHTDTINYNNVWTGETIIQLINTVGLQNASKMQAILHAIVSVT